MPPKHKKKDNKKNKPPTDRLQSIEKKTENQERNVGPVVSMLARCTVSSSSYLAQTSTDRLQSIEKETGNQDKKKTKSSTDQSQSIEKKTGNQDNKNNKSPTDRLQSIEKETGNQERNDNKKNISQTDRLQSIEKETGNQERNDNKKNKSSTDRLQSIKKKIGNQERNIVELPDEIEEVIDREDTTDIEDAIKKKSLSAVKYYYKENPSIINRKLKNRQTPLYIASRTGCLDIVKFLVSKGAKVNVVFHSFLTKTIPLLDATLNGYLPIVEFLLDNGANINFQNHCNVTALHIAVYENNFNLVKLLIERGADRLLQDIENKTPLEYAQNYKKDLIADYLSSIENNNKKEKKKNKKNSFN